MGEVYKARDPRLHRTVAIKVLPAVAADDADRRKRLLREARAASALNHPNIVAIYDIVSAAGRTRGSARVSRSSPTQDSRISTIGVQRRPMSDCAASRIVAAASAPSMKPSF